MYTIAALYHFSRFIDPDSLRAPLKALCEAQGVKGTLLVAGEGINGTIAGPAAGIDAVIAHIRALPGCADLEWKRSTATEPPFGKMKVRLKREIVTMGQPDVDPLARVGHYVDPTEWNDLIGRDDVAVIDTRNDYEVAIGTFDGAIDPKTQSFGEFPAWWEANKARNYLIGQGVEDVFHLKGGILKYLEDVPQEESSWQGDCFVFDNRVSVGHGLKEGPHMLCHGCRRPILPEDTVRTGYEEGVSCHQCVAETAEADKARFRERQHQILLSRARGEDHLG